MAYEFNKSIFKETFNTKEIGEKSVDALRLTHLPNKHFKLFPYKASGKSQAPIVYNLEDVVRVFFRRVAGIKLEKITDEELCECINKIIDVSESDFLYFKDMIQSTFFREGNFVGNNFGLYPYQAMVENKSADQIAQFLFNIFGLDEGDCLKIQREKENYSFNVLEKIVVQIMETKKEKEKNTDLPYFQIRTDVQEKFKSDFYFMLKTGMTSLEDFSNLFSLYYFYYMSQTCITLDKFCSGDRTDLVGLYYALDWEKVSKNRKCCCDGWSTLLENINHMFSHAITLEIINQCNDSIMYDYIMLGEFSESNPQEDYRIAQEVRKAAEIYKEYVGDYNKFDEINMPEEKGRNETDRSIQYLFQCVKTQFLETDRKRANQFYNEKFIEFCKSRWLKNRKKSGLVLNLTEQDVIFLTKISLKDNEKIRLKDLYKQYEYRGIYLDNSSKEYLQDFFTKLNLIDKKSDSGDAQYVKRIL